MTEHEHDRHDTTKIPPPNPLTEYVDGLVRGALAQFAAGVAPVVQRLVREELDRGAVERISEVRKAAHEGAANAVIDLITRVQRIEHSVYAPIQPCEDCPTRAAR